MAGIVVRWRTDIDDKEKSITINHKGGEGGERRDTAASKVRGRAGGAVIAIAAL